MMTVTRINVGGSEIELNSLKIMFVTVFMRVQFFPERGRYLDR